MKLSTLLARLGLTELARRAGVSPSTVRRWLRHGPSIHGEDLLRGVVARHRRSVKAAKTVKQQQRERFRDRLPVPVSPDLKPHRPTLGQFDDPLDLVPDKKPVESEKEIERAAAREGFLISGRVNTDTYEGESFWIHVGAPVLEADDDFVGDTAMDLWEKTTHKFVQVIFLFYRYVPFNPLYRGDASIRDWQGKWKPWWESTQVNETEYALRKDIRDCMDLARVSAESRVIWFEGFKVRTMNKKPNAPKNWRDKPLKQRRRTA